MLAGGLTWGLLPHTSGRDSSPTAKASGRPGFVPAASLLPPPEPDGRLTADALLAPSSLPWNSTYHWHTLITGHDPDTPLPETGRGQCRARWFEDSPTTDVIARTYAGQGKATAQHRIAAFSDAAGASGAASALSSRLRECGWHETRATEAASSQDEASHGESTDLYEYVLTSGPGDPVRVTLVQSDNRVAVLAVSTAVAYDHAHPDSRTDACLDKSLRNSSTAPSGSPRPTHTSEHC
ncbi:hypothetical protein [Streptomyces albogriseolus]|uniref:hypothetical protein n=1 Tax=Streptomyces albogriseolus TaxID=1887 RepID=UPI003461398D